MNHETVDRIEARLRDLVSNLDAARPVAAFDGDGTLWSGDVGEDFLEGLLEENAFTDVADQLFTRECAHAELSSVGGPRDKLGRLFEAYTKGNFSEERICELIAVAVAGRPLDDVRAFVEHVLDRKKLNERLHEETVELLARVRSLGIEPFVVSASPLVVVEAAAAHARIGIDRDHVVAATPLLVDGTVTTELDRPIPYGPGKVTRLRERIGGRPFVLAAGDNVFDLAMLTESSVPVAIRPKARLVARAQELPRLVTLARVD